MMPPTADGDDSVWRDVLRQTQIDQVTDKVLEQESIVREGNIWPASFLDIYWSRIFLLDKQTYHASRTFFVTLSWFSKSYTSAMQKSIP